jgi:hypothetical protein
VIGYADILARGGSPLDAVIAAREASTVAEAVGAGSSVDVGSRSTADALAAMALAGTGDRATAAYEIRP